MDTPLIRILWLAGIIWPGCLFAENNTLADHLGLDGITPPLSADFFALPDNQVIPLGTPVVYAVKVAEHAPRHICTWEIVDADGNLVKKGLGYSFKHTYIASGRYSVAATVWVPADDALVADMGDPPANGIVEHRFAVTVVEMAEILLRPMHNPGGLEWSRSATIAAGGVESPPHQAEVKMRITPVPASPYSVDMPVELVNAESYEGDKNASLDMLGLDGTVTFDSPDGIEYGILTSSDVMWGTAANLEPCEIRAGTFAHVSFAAFDDCESINDPPYISPENSIYRIVYTWKGAPLDNHDIRLFVESVRFSDSTGKEQVFLNQASKPDPAAVAPYAVFLPEQAYTDADGAITVAKWVADLAASGCKWTKIHNCYYDYSTRKLSLAISSQAPLQAGFLMFRAASLATVPQAVQGLAGDSAAARAAMTVVTCQRPEIDRILACEELYPALGVEVVDLAPGTAAADVGLQKGDVLLSIDGHPLHVTDDLIQTMRNFKAGETVLVVYCRAGLEGVQQVWMQVGGLTPDTARRQDFRPVGELAMRLRMFNAPQASTQNRLRWREQFQAVERDFGPWSANAMAIDLQQLMSALIHTDLFFPGWEPFVGEFLAKGKEDLSLYLTAATVYGKGGKPEAGMELLQKAVLPRLDELVGHSEALVQLAKTYNGLLQQVDPAAPAWGPEMPRRLKLGMVPGEAPASIPLLAGARAERVAGVSLWSVFGPAKEAGLNPGDVVYLINGDPVASHAEFNRALIECRPGDSALVRYFTAGVPHRVVLKTDTAEEAFAWKTGGEDQERQLTTMAFALPAWPLANDRSFFKNDKPLSARELEMLNQALWRMHVNLSYNRFAKELLARLEKETTSELDYLDTVAQVHADFGNSRLALEVYEKRLLPQLTTKDEQTRQRFTDFYQALSLRLICR